MVEAKAVLAAIIDVAQVGYPLLFALIAIETMGIPVPGEAALLAAAVLASRGELEIEVVIVLAASAAILGDNIGYLIGRHGGRRLLARPGRFETPRRRVLEYGEPFFARHGGKAVFFGRWMAWLRIWSAWLAGINRMRWPSFVFWNAAGGIAWAVSVSLVAYYLGEAGDEAIRTAGLAGGAGVVLSGAVVVLILRRRHRRAEERAERTGTDTP
jgi:membrane protein DedA with SNARE-associated domain